MSPKLSVYSAINTRVRNEDVCHVHQTDEFFIAALADGFSKVDTPGETGRDVAEEVIATFRNALPSLEDSFRGNRSMPHALYDVNSRIRETACEFESGSTLAMSALSLDPLEKTGASELYVSILGNTIVVCFDPTDEFEQVFIAGKSIIQMGGMHLFGRLGDKKWSRHHKGIQPVIESTSVKKGSVILMFTDGVVAHPHNKSDDLYPNEIFDCLRDIVDRARKGGNAEDLVNNAIASGSKDNVTALIARF